MEPDDRTHLTRGDVIARLLAVAWLGAGVQRAFVALDHDSFDRFQASRLHLDLLLGQVILASTAAAFLLMYPSARRASDLGLRQGCVFIAVLAMAGFFAIFATHDLLAYDYSN